MTKPDRQRTTLDFCDHSRDLTIEEARAEASRCAAAVTCRGCDTCRRICPDLAITSDMLNAVEIDSSFCRGCGLCEQMCPCGAIVTVGIP